MSTRLALYLLGSPRIELNHAPVSADRRKSLALLAYLALNPGTHTRDLLSAMFWPEYNQEKAFTNLRHLLWETQQALGEGWMLSTRDTLALAPNDATRTLWLDVEHFNGLLTESRAQSDLALRSTPLLDATKLYRNHFLTGFSLKDAPAFNEWANATAEELRQKLAEALTLLSNDYGTLGQFEQAIPHAQRLVSLDPLNETAHRQLMTIYLQAGQPNAALKQYQACEKLLRKELGLDPQPETRELYKQIRKGEIKFVRPPQVTEIGKPQHNLPHQLSTFIGRETELSELANLFSEHRLVTLIGTGGIGKTRLSLRAGEQWLSQYQRGVWFVEFAPLNDPALVPQALAKLFHIVEQADEPLTEKLVRVLKSQTMLLIFDNCEHVLDACAHLADTLLKSCPSLKILASSREPLGVAGEAQYHVPSLKAPTAEQILEKLLGYESIRLFQERAQLVNEKFALTLDNAASIAKICHRLDGIPLAIELAAARVNILSTEQIAARLDESLNLLKSGNRTTLPRHQTLRGSIDWSWNLLSEAEKILLRRLAVFAGGWTLEAAEEVCAGGSIRQTDVLDLLSNLVEKSLVFVDNNRGRHHILETIRQYAYEQLHTAGESETIRQQHLAWVLKWAEEIEPELQGKNQIARVQQAEAEFDNVRIAIEWGLANNQAENSMRICIALSFFFDGRNPFIESRRWLDRGLSMREQLTKKTLAKALSEVAWLTFRQNDPQAGLPYAQESLALSENLDDKAIKAYALRANGVVNISKGDFIEAQRYFEEARQLYKALGSIDGQAMAISNLALALSYQGDIRAGTDLLEKHIDIVENLSDISRYAWMQFALGVFKALLGELEQAISHLTKSLHIYRQLHDINFIVGCLLGFAIVATAKQSPVRSARLFGAGEALHESIAARLDPGSQRIYNLVIAQTRAMLSETDFASAWAEGRTLTLDEAIEYALHDI